MSQSSAARRRKAALTATALFTAALMFTGTLSFMYYGDHKTNQADATGEPTVYKARLVDNYDPASTLNWTVAQPAVPKSVSVLNPGNEVGGDNTRYGEIYARIQFKQYMEIFLTKQIYTKERYMTDEYGVFVSFATQQEAEDYLDELVALELVASDRPRRIDRVRMYSTPYLVASYATATEPSAIIVHYAGDYTASGGSADKYLQLCGEYGFTFAAGASAGGNSALFASGHFNKKTLADGGVADADLPWYIQTEAGDPNGVYGSFILLDIAREDTPVPLVAGQHRESASQANNSGGHHNDYIGSANYLDGTVPISTIGTGNNECNYVTRTWESGPVKFTGEDERPLKNSDGSAYSPSPGAVPWQYATVGFAGTNTVTADGTQYDTFQTYVQWNLGANVVGYTDWIQFSDKSKEDARGRWVIDDRSLTFVEPSGFCSHVGEPGHTVCSVGWYEGWVYWDTPIKPGEATSTFMDSMQLVTQPEGAFYYAMHIDMQAVSADSLRYWESTMPEQLYEFLKPVSITSFSVLPLHRNGFVSNGETFANVVSSPAADTAFGFLAFTSGQPRRRLDYKPVVRVYNSAGTDVTDTHYQDPDLNPPAEPPEPPDPSDGPPPADPDPNNYAAKGYPVTLTIPANMPSDALTVEVQAAQDDTGAAAVRFKLVVNPMTEYIDGLVSAVPRTAAQLNQNGNQTFIIDSWEWRVLSGYIGGETGGSYRASGYGGGDVLVVSEYMYAMVPWHDSNDINTGKIGSGSGYMASTIRNTTLPEYYAQLTWAHPYAVLPVTAAGSLGGQQSWTYLRGAYNNANNRTFSTGTKVTTGSGESATHSPDGLFLLSYADFGYSGQELWATVSNKIAREIHSTVNTTAPGVFTGKGKAAIQFMRTMYDPSTAWEVNASGGLACCTLNLGLSHNYYHGNDRLWRNHGVRPAMLLRLPGEP
ncbi:MAG: hypothetical protein LBI44_00175 [Oscillospiraceae bacterium]|nr:hypothetical protein [Oscillospiraceae bacterium]